MAATDLFGKKAIKAVMLLLFSVFSTFAQLRSHPYEELVTTSLKHQLDPLLQNVIYHPQYEVKTYDTVESSEMMCCSTRINGNNEEPSHSDFPPLHLVKYSTVEHNNLPPPHLTKYSTVEHSDLPSPHLSKYPTGEHSQTQPHRKRIVIKNLESIFRRVLLEVLLKIIRSILSVLQDPAAFSPSFTTNVPNTHQQMGGDTPHDVLQSPMKVFLNKLHNRPYAKSSYSINEPLLQSLSQKTPNSDPLQSSDCQIVTVGEC